MDTIEKIRILTDKQKGIGLPKTLIARYCGRTHNALEYYLRGTEPAPEVIELYEAGLRQMLEDIKKIIED